MRVTFKASPKLVKIGEIGESIAETDDSFRRQFSRLVLVAVRNREIPLRNNNGFKIPLESLDTTERQTRDFAGRRFLEKLGDFDGDLQRARKTASPEPWIQQHYGIDTKLQAIANEHEKFKQHIEPQIQSETNRLLDDWCRDASVLVSEVAAWFGKAHDFECQMAVSSSADGGEIARMLGKWFDKPLSVLSAKQRRYVDIYIPDWSELSAVERRACAIEADRKARESNAERIAQARSEQEGLASSPLSQRAMRDAFHQVAGGNSVEDHPQSRFEEVNLLDEQCIELARKGALTIRDWRALTGFGRGWAIAYLIKSDGVFFRKWTHEDMSEWSDEDRDRMEDENLAEPLLFPCTPAELLNFVDTAPHELAGFDVPEAFRQAVTESAQTAVGDCRRNLGTRKPSSRPRRNNKTRAILQAFFEAGVKKDIESVWHHIRTNAGKDRFPFSSASVETATDVDGKTLMKKNLERTLIRWPEDL